MVQLHQLVGEMQPDAGAEFRAVAFGRHLIETVEYGLAVLFRYSRPAVFHPDGEITRLDGGCHGDFAVVGSVFESVRQHVEHHFVDFVLVEPYLAYAVGHVERVSDVLFVGHLRERRIDGFKEFSYTGLSGVQLSLRVVELSQLHNLVYEPEYAFAVLVDEIVGLQQCRVVRLADKLLYRAENQCERCAHLVGYVREELDF